MRPLPRAAVSLGLAAGVLLGPLAAIGLAAGSGSTTAGVKAEAWYRLTEPCTLPVGCAPTNPPSPYAADTLHVGVSLGTEESRTYLALDLSGLPGGTKPAGGQLRLPVATGPQDGTVQPELATLRACLLAGTVKEVDGASTKPPVADCELASAPAVFVPASGTVPAAFTVDLTALATAWQESAAPGGIALVPTDAPMPEDTWHVAFHGRERTGVPKTTATVSYVSQTVDSVAQPPPPVTAPVEQVPVEPAPVVPDTGFAPTPALVAPAPALPGQAPVTAGVAPGAAPVPAVVSGPAPALVPVATSVLTTGFRYPAVLLLPLVFLVAVGWVARAVTRDLVATA